MAFNIFKSISTAWKVKHSFRPFLKNIKNDYRKLSPIDLKLTQKVQRIYQELKTITKPKIQKLVKEYEETFEKVENHNLVISEINSFIELWDYDNLIFQPLKINKDNLDHFNHIRSLINGFTIKDEKYETIFNQICDICDNYDELCLEYDAKVKYDKLLDLSKYDYINLETQRNIVKSAENIICGFRRTSNFYNDFSKHLGIVALTDEHNEKYIEEKSKLSIFDNINQRSLDKEQRKSVLTDENSTLVVAGAGSGKTLTICGKVHYLIDEEKVKPSDILLLSYSNKSAEDLQKKVEKIHNGLTVGTFHKIGLDILKSTQQKTFVVESQYKAIIEQYFREELKNRPQILEAVLEYYGLYLFSNDNEKKYNNSGELFEDLKKADFVTLKNQLLMMTSNYTKRETIKKELVKSFEEMALANWYFINGIDYEYEKPYKFNVSTEEKRQYTPDFYLPKYKIYHEHYGIDKNGRAKQLKGLEEQAYLDSLNWKRSLHEFNQTTCLETFSYEFEDGTVFEKLKQELLKRNVEFHPLSQSEIYNALQSIYEGKAFKSFINLIRTFLSLYKATYRDAHAFDTLIQFNSDTQYQVDRASLFISIVKDVYSYYMDSLKRDGKIDFDDMILQSTYELDHTEKFKFKYIIVDEFQDISVSRMQFLKKLIQHGSSKLFAVGDDWQAIYRFSGCDLNIFLRFPEYFGDSAITKITSTHRNSQELQDIAGPFVKANPEQFNKDIYSVKHLNNPVQIMYYTENKYFAFLKVLSEIDKLDHEAEVLVLGRNNKDIEDIALDSRISIDYKRSNETKTFLSIKDYPRMNLSYSTVHGSKGLEADYVVIINADDSRLGFPNKMEDDVLLNMVLSSKSNFEYAEERRLWYVALTRTKNYTYILANNEHPSIFVQEILNKCLIMNPDMELTHEGEIKCPHCKSGRLVERRNENDGTKFFGCSNYPYCDYTIDDSMAVARNKRCPRCGDFMIYKKGPYGPFYGCHNYPRCKHKEEYIPTRRH